MENEELFYIRTKETNDGSYWFYRHLWKFVHKYFFKTSPSCFKHWRVFLLRIFGAHIGRGCYIASSVGITSPYNFEMGNYSSIDENVYVIGPMIIGDYVSVGSCCVFVSAGHNVTTREFGVTKSVIQIDNGAFIGAGAKIGMGGHIGQMSVIGAFAQVMENIPENTVTMAMPIKTIQCKRLPDEEYALYRYGANNK